MQELLEAKLTSVATTQEITNSKKREIDDQRKTVIAREDDMGAD